MSVLSRSRLASLAPAAEFFCDLGMLDEEETKCSELGKELKLALGSRYLLMEQIPVTVDAWPQRTKRCQFHHFTHEPRSLCWPR
jgi:hypothetical protein